MDIKEQNIYISDCFSRYDAACKRLLSNKIFLAWIMKYCVSEYADCEIDDIVEHYIEGVEVSTIGVNADETNAQPLSDEGHIAGLKTEETSITEGSSTFDIRFFALAPKSEGFIKIIINVEAQNKFNPGYPLIRRALYYCSRLISSQNGVEFSGKDYQNIKKVYSIWLCMDPPKKWQNNISRYSVTEEKLIGDAKEEKENYDLMTAVMICLGDEDQTETLSSDYKPLLKMLEVLFSQSRPAREKKQIMHENFGINFTKPMETEAGYMCNLSQGVYEKGVQFGFQQGKEHWMQQGMQQGMQLGGVRMLCNLVRGGLLNVSQASEQAMLSEEEFKEKMKEFNC